MPKSDSEPGREEKNTSYVETLVTGIRKGDTAALARAITLVESNQEKDRNDAIALIEECLAPPKQTLRVGITGVPGVGKSTFIETFGTLLTQLGKKVAVLAIDPTSKVSKGSIMGDKTRMEKLGQNPLAFIRPSPASENLGGVARNTREAMILCEAAGFDLILIETVGVGQSETVVHSMVDFFLLLQLTGAGDELQGIKRGIVEMADAIVINKADGKNTKQVAATRNDYERALELYPLKENGWKPRVMSCSALKNTGIEEIWELINDYSRTYWENGNIPQKRREQNKYWFKQAVENQLMRDFYSNSNVRMKSEILMEKVLANELSPFRAASLLLQAYRQELK